MGGQEDPIIIEKTSLSIEGHVNGQNTCPKPGKYWVKIAKTKTTTGRGLRPRPTGARSAPVDVVVFVFAAFTQYFLGFGQVFCPFTCPSMDKLVFSTIIRSSGVFLNLLETPFAQTPFSDAQISFLGA